jgi:hypothetical protein
VRLTSILGGVAAATVVAWAIFDSGDMAMLIAIVAVFTAVQVVLTWQHLH